VNHQHLTTTALFFFFFSVLRLELRPYTLSHPTSLFVMGIFEIGSQELFSLVDFEL
jgi:hypothetical protein